MRRTKVSKLVCGRSCGRRDSFCGRTVTHGGRLASFLQRGGFDSLSNQPGIAVCAKVTSFASPGAIGIILPSRRVRLRNGRVFVGAKTADVVPTVSKIGRDGRICADAGLLSLSVLPHRLVVMNNKCVKLRFTSVCTRFKDGMAVLRKKDTFVPHRSHSVTSDMHGMLRGGKMRVHLGTHTRSVRSATSKIALTCAGATSSIPYFIRNSTVLLTANQGPVVRNLGLRTTNMGMSTRNTVVASMRLRAAAPRV